jgi:hypothetical protein
MRIFRKMWLLHCPDQYRQPPARVARDASVAFHAPDYSTAISHAIRIGMLWRSGLAKIPRIDVNIRTAELTGWPSLPARHRVVSPRPQLWNRLPEKTSPTDVSRVSHVA